MELCMPKGFLDLIHYKIGYNLYSFLQCRNHSNIIIYGNTGSGKSILVKNLLRDIYPGKVKHMNVYFCLSLHNNYYLFRCSYITNKLKFMNYIKNIVKTYDHYNNQCKYIILDQFEKLNTQMQNIMKVIIEKAYYTCKFIIITNQYNKAIPPIKSRCICIRVPSPTQYDKYIYCKRLLDKSHLSYNDFLLSKDCKSLTLQDIIYKYHSIIIIKNGLYNSISSFIHKSTLTYNHIHQIRSITSKIKELDINPTYIMNRIIFELKESDPYKKVIHACNDYNYRIINSYRELIHIESLIIYLNLIMNHIY